MDSLGTFYKKRIGYTIVFAMPIIFVAIAVGVFADMLGDNGVTLSILGIVILAIVVMFVRRRLPWPLGPWQRLWQSIPTWKQRAREGQQGK